MLFLEYITNMDVKKETLQYLRLYRSYLVAKERFEKHSSDLDRARNAQLLIHNDYIVQVKYNKKVITGKVVGYVKDSRERFCLESEELDCQEKEYPVPDFGTTYKAKRKYFPFSSIVSYSYYGEKYSFPKGEVQEFHPFEFKFEYINQDFRDYLEYEFQTKEAIDSGIKELSPFKTKNFDEKRQQAIWNFNHYDGYGVGFELVEFYYKKKPIIGVSVAFCNDKDFFRAYSNEFFGRNYKIKIVPKAFFIRVIKNPELRDKLLHEYYDYERKTRYERLNK